MRSFSKTKSVNKKKGVFVSIEQHPDFWATPALAFDREVCFLTTFNLTVLAWTFRLEFR